MEIQKKLSLYLLALHFNAVVPGCWGVVATVTNIEALRNAQRGYITFLLYMYVLVRS